MSRPAAAPAPDAFDFLPVQARLPGPIDLPAFPEAAEASGEFGQLAEHLPGEAFDGLEMAGDHLPEYFVEFVA